MGDLVKSVLTSAWFGSYSKRPLRPLVELMSSKRTL